MLSPDSFAAKPVILVVPREMDSAGAGAGAGAGAPPPLPLPPTRLTYFDHMGKLQSTATVLSATTGEIGYMPLIMPDVSCSSSPLHQTRSDDETEKIKSATASEGDRVAVVLDQTIMYPQGGGQPFDIGSMETIDGTIKFHVTDVRAKSGVVHHYGKYYPSTGTGITGFKPEDEVKVVVDSTRRLLNSRLHTAGHLLDACMSFIGLGYLEPGKGHHFPESPFVEYKGAIAAHDIESKRLALEVEVNRQVLLGGQVRAMIVPYSEAAALCGGSLPDYIAKDSRPRIVCLGENPGCPCGGTHVSDISEVGEVKVTQIRVKKGVSKVSYNLAKISA